MVQGMTEAEAKRQQQRRAWDAEHLHSIGTKLTPVELARLDAYCFWIRTTRYSLLRTLVLEELAAYERENRVTLDDPRAATETAAERDEVAGRVIAAAAAMNDVMNLQAVRVVAQRAAVAVTGIDGLSCLVRDGCGQVSFGLHDRSPLSFDTRAATRLSRVADRPLAKPLTGVLSTEFSTNERGLDSEDRRQQHPS